MDDSSSDEIRSLKQSMADMTIRAETAEREIMEYKSKLIEMQRMIDRLTVS